MKRKKKRSNNWKYQWRKYKEAEERNGLVNPFNLNLTQGIPPVVFMEPVANYELDERLAIQIEQAPL